MTTRSKRASHAGSPRSPNYPNTPKSSPNPMDSILDGLNSAQGAAVSSPSPILQVLAPPGSGKTKTLTARVAYLLAHHGYRPQDVICCTFTIKASREMRERLAKLVGDQVQSKLILGTFHSICRRYLVTYGYLIGLRKGFGIADSGDSLAIIRRIVKRLKLDIQPNMARGRISYQKAHGVTPEDLEAKRMKGSKVLEHREFVQVYQTYETHLADSNLLDYDDLLLRCAQLLRQHPECVANVQSVLVDEFQDTNHIQYELMNLFASKNRRITVVGDPDQSIYGFRSAEIKNLTRMQQLYSDTSVVLLEDNYRSSGSILSSAQDVIEQDSSRPAKRLQPTHSVGTMPVLRKLPTAEAEAQWIVLEIKRCIAMTGQLLKYSDFAILLRSAALSRHIESEMGKQGMPYRMVGGLRFFDRVEIKLLLDYLRVISQPGNTDALLRIINVPSRKIGEESVRLLIGGTEKANKPLWEFMKDVAQGRRSTEKTLSKPTSQGLSIFVGLIESSRQKLLECTDCSAPKKLLEFVIKKLCFREYLTSTYGTNEENKWANVEELLSQAEDTAVAGEESGHDDSLPEIEGLSQQQAHPGEEALSRFLANVALSTEILQQEGGEGEGFGRRETVALRGYD
ncbi:P-loop containing nucleoside triphosphate hydrolase protein [Aspergillus bertholletiae]|uniref:DNA 3'-5' helicase n=1 Tax=Aspergillus bertholletiae TaxID=1226010 RepID=A0A5N7BAV7_9EURO|nr:P-loop containing nucleoside triphosphate hydrolase protein [Aspergillus bertholletiae]